MAPEVFPQSASLHAGESQSFVAREKGTVLQGVSWAISPASKGTIVSARGVYASPRLPPFVTKEITVIARKTSAPEDFGTATVQLSSAHTWIVVVASYLAVCAVLLAVWGHCQWNVAFLPDGNAATNQDSGAAAQNKPQPNSQAQPTNNAPKAEKKDSAATKDESTAATDSETKKTDSNTTKKDGAASQSGGSEQQRTLGTQGTSGGAGAKPGENSPGTTGSGAENGLGKPDTGADGDQGRLWALLCLVMIFGAGGALLHAVRSLYGYVGNKQFEPNWAPFYFARPFEGAVLALLTVFMTQKSIAGELSANPNPANVWAVLGLAGLVGLFTDKALLKLGQIFDSVLTPPADTRSGKLGSTATAAPVLAKLSQEGAAVGSDATEVQITGDRFENGMEVQVNDTPRVTVFENAKSLKFTLTKADLAQAGTLNISVKGRTATSNELPFVVK